MRQDDDPGHEPTPSRADDEAVDWAVRMADPETADWDGFTDWLERDPAHAERYDRITAMLQDAAKMVPIAAANDTGPAASAGLDEVSGRRHGWRWAGGAIAASIAGVFAIGLWTMGPRPYTIETRAGERRTIVLDDGTRIALSGASSLRLDRADRRMAMLDHGEALFRVRHDAAHPFAVTAGSLRLTDLGTVFDVNVAKAATRVAVAEGAVMVDPDGAALRLDPGQAAVTVGDHIRRERIEPADVGAWEHGRLAFEGATLDDVSRELSRHLARPVRASPAVAARVFRGTLDLEALKDDPGQLGSLLGVRIRQDVHGWTLEAR